MKKQITMMIALFTVVAMGCKKDKDSRVDDGDGNGKVKYISKVTETNGGEETVYLATYDGQNRIVSYNSQDNTEKTTFTYDANSNLIKYETGGGIDKEIFEVTYSAANVPVSGKHKTYNNLTVINEEDLTYTVANGNVTEIQFKQQNNETTTYKMAYQNNNVTKIEVATEDGIITLSGTYGTKKSPFAGLSLKHLIAPVHLFGFYSKNEVTSITSSIDGEAFARGNIAYTFGSDGYPLTSSSTNPDDPAEAPFNTKFEYK